MAITGCSLLGIESRTDPSRTVYAAGDARLTVVSGGPASAAEAPLVLVGRAVYAAPPWGADVEYQGGAWRVSMSGVTPDGDGDIFVRGPGNFLVWGSGGSECDIRLDGDPARRLDGTATCREMRRDGRAPAGSALVDVVIDFTATP